MPGVNIIDGVIGVRNDTGAQCYLGSKDDVIRSGRAIGKLTMYALLKVRCRAEGRVGVERVPPRGQFYPDRSTCGEARPESCATKVSPLLVKFLHSYSPPAQP